MNPFVKTEDELQLCEKECLVAHVRWLYAYIEEIKYQLRTARIRV